MSILVLTNSLSSPLVEKIFNLGFLPQVAEHMDKMVEGLQHQTVSVVFVDTKHLKLDLLESLVTIHDETTHIPIYVWGPLTDGAVTEFIKNHGNVYAFDELEEVKHIIA